jgi:hypothetical protein
MSLFLLGFQIAESVKGRRPDHRACGPGAHRGDAQLGLQRERARELLADQRQSELDPGVQLMAVQAP